MSDVISGPYADKVIATALGVRQEDAGLEFKRIGGSKVVGKILETVVAMANTDGGFIVIGIDDPEKSKLVGHKRIFGIEENQDNFDDLTRKLFNIKPVPVEGLSVSRARDSNSGKTIAILYIPKATTTFHNFGDSVFVRKGKSNHKLVPQEYADMAYAKGFKKADQELMEEVDLSLLDTQWFRVWRTQRGLGGTIDEILTKTGLARKNKGGETLPTRAAVLLFAEFPDSLMADTKCSVRIFRYDGGRTKYGAEPNLMGNIAILEGPAIELISKAQKQVLEILARGVKVKSGFVTQYAIPERVIQEAITNAVIHRDYHMKKDIEIRIYEDRVEVVSPGMFVYNITIHNIGDERASDYRNNILVKHLREFPEPPNLDVNEGVKSMISEMKKNNLYPPAYLTWPTPDDTGLKYYVKVRLINENTPDEWAKVEDYLKRNGTINNKVARSVTGVVQGPTMSRLFKKWMDQGLIERMSGASQSRRDYEYRLRTKKEFDPKLFS